MALFNVLVLIGLTKPISSYGTILQATHHIARGDESRSQEGSGLGLAIAKGLAQAQQGRLDIAIDGDLFKTVLSLPVVK